MEEGVKDGHRGLRLPIWEGGEPSSAEKQTGV